MLKNIRYHLHLTINKQEEDFLDPIKLKVYMYLCADLYNQLDGEIGGLYRTILTTCKELTR